jgi:hypothetical protein
MVETVTALLGRDCILHVTRETGELGIEGVVDASDLLHEEQAFQFRAEAFNIWNHTNYNNVDTTMDDGKTGQVLGAGGEAYSSIRSQIQLLIAELVHSSSVRHGRKSMLHI